MHKGMGSLQMRRERSGRRVWRASRIAGACCALALLGMTSASPAFGSTAEFKLAASPDNIAVGPDGDLWFTEFSAEQVVRMTVFDPGWQSPFRGIISGPEGRLWFSGVGGLGKHHDRGTDDPVRRVRRTGIGLRSRHHRARRSDRRPGRSDLFPGRGGPVVRVPSRPSHRRGQPARVAARNLYAGMSIVATGNGLWVDTSGSVNNLEHPTHFLPPELMHIAYDGQTTTRTLAAGRDDTQLPNGMTVAGASVWIADAASLLRLNPRTGKLTRIRLPVARFPAGRDRTLEYYGLASVLAAGPHDQVWFTAGNGILGELHGPDRFSYWRIPAGATAGLAVLPHHGVYITYSDPAMIVVHH